MKFQLKDLDNLVPLMDEIQLKFWQKGEGYLPSPELSAAVNVALALDRPLLLTGEPGTGKTELAYYLSQQFGLNPIIVFNAQTSSIKKDLFYQYDALGHFHWAQTNREGNKQLNQEDFEERLNLIRYEGLGKAIRRAANEQKKSVVLIDEIDKAPRDLPNDLLSAIDDLTFDVPEIPGAKKINYTCPKNLHPIIIITSNSEKNLPDAFLRRIVYFHIKFPDRKSLLEILKTKTVAFKNIDTNSLTDYFLSLREMPNLTKRPATAEFIAWAAFLAQTNFPTSKLQKIKTLSKMDIKLLNTSFSILAKTRDDLENMQSQLNKFT